MSKITRYLISQGCRRHDAEEIAQDVELKLFTNPPENPTWAYTRAVARNQWISWVRKHSRMQTFDPDNMELVSPTKTSDPRMDVLLSCLSKLGESDRKVLTDHYWNKLSREDAADKYSISKDGWKNRLQRAKSRLRKLIEDENNEYCRLV